MADIHVAEYFGTGYTVISYVPRMFWMQNCYILCTAGGNLLIDPGYDCLGVADLVREPRIGLHAILLTHAHHDHMASAEPLSKALGIPVYLHPADRLLMMKAPMYGMVFAKREVVRPTELHCLDDAKIEEMRIRYGIQISHTPGHTPGGITIFCENFVFTGDNLVHRQLGRTDRPEGNLRAMLESVERTFVAGRGRGAE
ncbi:MAG: MBL fold metallo-hydrolase, partial [Oscillospiraceae bacterium]|nr:MBL fold metallo-hydrolase [Oscillospiraceae bacterium]